MNLIEEAKKLGFSDAAIMDTKDLVFVPDYRMYCEQNLCGCYNVNPACPPESGTVEEMKERALKYNKDHWCCRPCRIMRWTIRRQSFIRII